MGTEPIDENPSNEAFVLSLLEGYAADEAEGMETKTAPTRYTSEARISPRSIERSYPRIEPRRGASPERPNRSPWSAVSCTSVPHLEYYSDASPSPRAAS
jgi:hypothetical protein